MTSDEKLAAADKESRTLRRKLERSLEQLRIQETVNDQNQALMRAIHAEVEEHRARIAQQNEALRELNARIAQEQKISESLLLNILPSPIAARLKARSDTIADSFDDVSVLFADIVGFTKLSAHTTPEALVAMLNEIFTGFDALADHHGLEKIKTIGDAYMAAAGLPEPTKDHAQRTARMALGMLDVIQGFNAAHAQDLQVRIGINTGPVVAGVIGKRKFIYDLWGDAVNTASRMESHGVPGRVHLTDVTRRALGETFTMEDRGVIEVKGKGPLRTWLLVAAA